MDETMASRYWCHSCSTIVFPIMELEIKCPYCDTGFVEEMDTPRRESGEPDSDTGSDRALSLWAPILLGMIGNPRHRRGLRHFELSDEEDDREDSEFRRGGETEIESIIRRRRRRRSSAAIMQLVQGIRAGIASEYGSSEADRDEDEDGGRDEGGDGNRERGRGRERLILINPSTQTLIIRDTSPDPDLNQNIIGLLGDYFTGSNLDLLLRHLAENDPNRYGTPPAKKEVIEAMPTVKIKEKLQCSVCLDDFEIGEEAKEMPCKHRFHSKCILPWLELHSSCPICRYQLPSDEFKIHSEGQREQNNSSEQESNGGGSNSSQDQDGTVDGGNGNSRRFSFWPFSGLFSSSSTQAQSEGANSSSASSSANTNENTSERDSN